MCDSLWQRMANDQGYLADIVRTGGGNGPSAGAELLTADWQLPAQPMLLQASSVQGPAKDFGDPFVNLRDPLLSELTGVEFLNGAETTTAAPVKMAMESGGTGGGGGGLMSPKILMGDEVRRPCSALSRVLQISPATAKPSPLSLPAIKPPLVVANEMMKAKGSPVAGPADHDGGVQISSPRTPGIKRRKSQAKKVVCIPAPAAASNRPNTGEVVPSDLWAWRKYGQKPIKGSPYPRAYYRCSSSKGCSARKQVERSRTDPNMLVITYTSEHNHPWPTQRNALAGSTRSQPTKNGSSASKSSNHSLKSTTAPKEEPMDTSNSSPAVKEEVSDQMEKAIDPSSEDNDEFDQVFHNSYQAMIPERDQSDDLFVDLAELEADPMSLIFYNNNMETKPDHEKAFDPFNMFDWAGSSFGEVKKG